MSDSDRKRPTAVDDKTVARLAAVLETAVDAIITTDEHGKIETFNRGAEKMFRCNAKDVVGLNVATLMPARHAPHHRRYMQEYGEAGKHRVIGRTRDLKATRPDGSEFPIELALSGADIAGQRFFTAIIRDVSERRHAEAELQRYRERLENLVAERTAELQAANEQLERSSTELREANSRLEQLARKDELTDVGNRRAFDERLDLEWRRQQRRERALALLLCDVDFFKQYNDYYGHPAGDDCLRRIAAALRRCFKRADDFVARFGGEEFAVVLSGADLDAAIERAETMRRGVNALGIAHGGLGPQRTVSISVGVASTVPSRAADADALIEAADAALYRAKQKGRNRIEMGTV